MFLTEMSQHAARHDQESWNRLLKRGNHLFVLPENVNTGIYNGIEGAYQTMPPLTEDIQLPGVEEVSSMHSHTKGVLNSYYSKGKRTLAENRLTLFLPSLEDIIPILAAPGQKNGKPVSQQYTSIMVASQGSATLLTRTEDTPPPIIDPYGSNYLQVWNEIYEKFPYKENENWRDMYERVAGIAKYFRLGWYTLDLDDPLKSFVWKRLYPAVISNKVQ
jgi:hypothetical protein